MTLPETFIVRDGEIGRARRGRRRPEIEGAEASDGDGMLDGAAVVDQHVQLPRSGPGHKEDSRTGTRSADAGC